MLTRDLILCRCRANKLYPAFIASDQPELLALAEQLLTVFRQGLGQSQAELEVILNQLISGFTPLALGKGLRKLLVDRCEFSTAGEIDYPTERQAVLLASARLWREQSWDSPESFLAALRQEVGAIHPLLNGKGLYADHPDHDILLSFKELSARQLLDRYNLSLVQALLLTADRLELRLTAPAPAKLRRLCKYLRFFRLLCRIRQEKNEDKNASLNLQIDGPASIFQNARRYGLQLATFFPAVCTLPQWELRAEVLWREKSALLQLDQSSGLVGHYRHFGAYIPEEIKLFQEHFAKTSQDWKIIDDPQFLHGEANELIFPDCSFVKADGQIQHLELFHRHHAGQLTNRLEWLAKHPEIPLILGVDKALLRNQELEELLAANAWFQQNGFLFRDYPTCEKARQCLNRNK